MPTSVYQQHVHCTATCSQAAARYIASAWAHAHLCISAACTATCSQAAARYIGSAWTHSNSKQPSSQRKRSEVLTNWSDWSCAIIPLYIWCAHWLTIRQFNACNINFLTADWCSPEKFNVLYLSIILNGGGAKHVGAISRYSPPLPMNFFLH